MQDVLVVQHATVLAHADLLGMYLQAICASFAAWGRLQDACAEAGARV